MSRENVDAVLTMIAAWNRGDCDGWLTPMHPDVEWSSAILREIEGRAGGTRRGHAELRRFWEEWHSVWAIRIEPEELQDVGDVVLAFTQTRTSGKTSGALVERPMVFVSRFDGGLARKISSHLTAEEALEAAGLSE